MYSSSCSLYLLILAENDANFAFSIVPFSPLIDAIVILAKINNTTIVTINAIRVIPLLFVFNYFHNKFLSLVFLFFTILSFVFIRII